MNGAESRLTEIRRLLGATTEELRPCPFCGSKAERLVSHRPEGLIACSSETCALDTWMRPAAWNKRSPADGLLRWAADRVEELERLLLNRTEGLDYEILRAEQAEAALRAAMVRLEEAEKFGQDAFLTARDADSTQKLAHKMVKESKDTFEKYIASMKEYHLRAEAAEREAQGLRGERDALLHQVIAKDLLLAEQAAVIERAKKIFYAITQRDGDDIDAIAEQMSDDAQNGLTICGMKQGDPEPSGWLSYEDELPAPQPSPAAVESKPEEWL